MLEVCREVFAEILGGDGLLKKNRHWSVLEAIEIEVREFHGQREGGGADVIRPGLIDTHVGERGWRSEGPSCVVGA